jgi:hypothetical protein
VPDQHRTLDAARVQLIHHGASVSREPGWRLWAEAVSGPVGRDDADLSGQLFGYLLPVVGRSWLTVQEYQIMTTQPVG